VTRKEDKEMNTGKAVPILVTGGTGTLGRLVVPRLQEAGHAVRVVSRQSRSTHEGVEFMTGDLATGEGVEAAVDGVDVVVHLAGTARGDEDKARHLVAAVKRTGTRHLVYISVVGADRVPVVSGVDRAMFGYFASKRGAERVVAESGVPWTTLWATQFHELMLTNVEKMARLPVIPVPARVRFQPVAGDEVAARLVELALDAPAGLVTDIAGPRVYGMNELVRGYLKARGKHRLMLPIHLPGKAARAVREGANLATGPGVGRRTWEEFLADRLTASGGREAGVVTPHGA